MHMWMEMLTGRNRKQYPVAQVLPYIGFAALFLLFWWRAYRGFDWSDESAVYAAAYRLVLGDLPLVDSWDTHAGWSLLMAPALAWYKQWNGSMDGVILAGRLCFLVVQTAAAVVVYRRLLGFSRSHLAAMLGGWLTAAFVPGMILNFSPQSAGLLSMVLSCTSLLWGLRRESPRLWPSAIQAGLWAGLAAVIYPSFLPAAIPMGVMLLFCRPVIPRKKGRTVLSFLCFWLGVALPVVLFLLYLGNMLGWKTLWDYFPWLITSRKNPFSGYGKAVFTFFQGYSKSDPLYLAEFSILILMLLSRWVRIPLDLPFDIKTIFQSIVKIALPICILANVVIIIAQEDWDVPANIKMGHLLAAAGIWPIILCILNPSRRSKLLLLGMYLPGQMMALGAHLTDRPGDFGASFALLPSMLAAVLIVYENYGPLLRSINHGSMETVVAAIRTCMVMVAFFLLGTTIMIRAALAYRDLPVSQLNTEMTSGPAKGILTTEIDAGVYDSMVQEIRENEGSGESMLILGNLPFGYLCTDCLPATPMVSSVSTDSQYLYDYLVEDLSRRPKWIYAPKPAYGYGNGENLSVSKEIQWISGQNMEVKESVYSFVYTISEEETEDVEE